MDYLFAKWDKVKKRLSRKQVFFFLDYDGTLTPIVDSPSKAVLPVVTRRLLRKLSKRADCIVAIISGRSLDNIKKIVGLKEVIYAGNHGLEIEGPKIKFESQITPRLKSIIRHINDDLVNKLSRIRGVFIEDKGLTISVHYRLVYKKDIQELMSIFAGIIKPYIIRHKIEINPGKKVFEIRPPLNWNKGRAAVWLLARQQFMQGDGEVFPVYIGDDVTDEDAFKALKNKGVTIFVGRTKISYAQYYLKDTNEVTKFLKKILVVRKKDYACQN